MQLNTIKDRLLKKSHPISLKKKKKQSTHKNSPRGYIEYINGLYLGGWIAYDKSDNNNANYENCKILINGNPVCQFIPEIEREDLSRLPEVRHGKGFDWKLPVKPIEKILKKSEKLTFSISVNQSNIQHEITIEKDVFYRSVASTLKSDINHYISLSPLINEESINYLTEWNKLFLIDSLFQSGLYKELVTLIGLIIPKLDFDKEAKSDYYQLLNKVRFNPDFVAAFLQQTGSQYYQHPLSDKITEVLCQLPYLKAKDLISSYSSSPVRENLVEVCTSSESKKFEFIEHFPEEQDKGLLSWNSLTEELKKDYWPLLAGALQYQNRSNELKLINCDPAWYLKPEQSDFDRNEALRLAITNPDNDWFALSFVVQALETNRDPVVVAELLKEYAWKIWNLNYFNTDSFCYVADTLVKKLPNKSVYKDLVEAFDNVLRFKICNDVSGLKRETFQKSLARLINTGISCQCQDFIALENTARPALSLSEVYTDSLCFKELEAFDYNIYHEFKHFYDRIRKIKSFFNSFDSSHTYSNEELASIVPELLTLKRGYGVEGIDQHFLALSRYIQLTERTDLFDLLKAIHIEMGDIYSALQLEKCPVSRKELMRKITEHGEKARRKDSYWFKTALHARSSKGHEQTRSFIKNLAHFLNSSVQSDQINNPDLTELLVSECLWLAKHDAIEEDELQHIKPLVNTKEALSTWLKLKLYISLKLNKEQDSINLIHQLSEQLGSIANLTDTLDILDSSINDITDQERQKILCRKITENGIYPYLKVMVYSCNKYESTRHQIIRDTWLKDLKSCGIDYAFIVGDAENAHCENDKIRLDVPDTYEELPHKSLRMFEFAAQSSSHQYYYKLDDDCVLNIKAMFGDPAFLGHDYFGRIVNRPMGGVDRSWHHQKSTTNEAKTSLDLSPELSSYGDGSTGYILSRNAINKMNKQAKSYNNIELISSSYFEDKLVGDLLALSGIHCIDKGYNCVIRRNVANGRDVQIWDYGLLPNAVTNIKVLHTEDDKFRREFYKQLHDEWSLDIPNLLYRDITADMTPKWLENSEEPVIKAYKLNKKAIEKASVVAIIVGKNEQEFLPNLLQHHRDLGVEHFMFVDNASSDSSIDYMMEQEDVSIFIATQDYKHSRFGVNWQETLCQHYCLGKWTLIIDSDELFMFDGFETHSIQELVELADLEGANAVLSPMIDFYPEGSLDSADITNQKPFYETCCYFDSLSTMSELKDNRYGPFSNSKVYSSGIRERIFGRYNAYPSPNYLNQKYNLIKYNPGMQFVEGLHFMAGHKIFSKQCGIMHFKYHSKFHTKIIREIKSGQHWNNGAEYRRYLELFNQNDAPQLSCNKASIKYTNSSDLKMANYISGLEW